MTVRSLGKLHSYGLNDWLFTLENSGLVLGQLHSALTDNSLISETVVGYDSLLIRVSTPLSEVQLRQIISSALAESSLETTPAKHHAIIVRYDGPDIDDVCSATGLSPARVIELHTVPLYTVRFLGFSPGFAYLDGLDPLLQLPRRSTPRPRMHTGAVAIGGAHAGIYSIPSPGGWNWLGNTEHPLFDKSGTDASAFTLHPGDTLRFISAD